MYFEPHFGRVRKSLWNPFWTPCFQILAKTMPPPTPPKKKEAVYPCTPYSPSWQYGLQHVPDEDGLDRKGDDTHEQDTFQWGIQGGLQERLKTGADVRHQGWGTLPPVAWCVDVHYCLIKIHSNETNFLLHQDLNNFPGLLEISLVLRCCHLQPMP